MFLAILVVVILVGLSMELKLNKLTRIGLAILAELRALRTEAPNPKLQAPERLQAPPEQKKPPPVPVPAPPAKAAATAPRVYKLD